jgi:hypothetical protein
MTEACRKLGGPLGTSMDKNIEFLSEYLTVFFKIFGQKVLVWNLDLASNRNQEPGHNRRRHR